MVAVTSTCVAAEAPQLFRTEVCNNRETLSRTTVEFSAELNHKVSRIINRDSKQIYVPRTTNLHACQKGVPDLLYCTQVPIMSY